jgi:hypothetical protein
MVSQWALARSSAFYVLLLIQFCIIYNILDSPAQCSFHNARTTLMIGVAWRGSDGQQITNILHYMDMSAQVLLPLTYGSDYEESVNMVLDVGGS